MLIRTPFQLPDPGASARGWRHPPPGGDLGDAVSVYRPLAFLSAAPVTGGMLAASLVLLLVWALFAGVLTVRLSARISGTTAGRGVETRSAMTSADGYGTPPEPEGADVRVLVAGHPHVVRARRGQLRGVLHGIDVVGVAIDGDDAVRQVRRLDPDVVLMDLHMPNCNGVQATDELTSSGARARVVVLTTYSDDDWVFAALRAGARGFLTKDAGAEEIRHAITTVAAGQAQLDPSVQRRLLEALATGSAVATPADVPAGTSSTAPVPDGLTPREVDVLTQIAGGLSNVEVAAALYVSEATVKTHVNHLLAKTGMRDRAQLVTYAFRHGLVRP